jgi:hypothetical protein
LRAHVAPHICEVLDLANFGSRIIENHPSDNRATLLYIYRQTHR